MSFFSERRRRRSGVNVSNTIGVKKRFKFKIKINRTSFSKSASILKYGSVGLKAQKASRLTYKQIDGLRKSLIDLRDKVDVWVRLNPLRPLTKKPSELRMGKGKGKVKYFVTTVFRGQILAEISDMDVRQFYRYVRSALCKFPIPLKIVKKFVDY